MAMRLLLYCSCFTLLLYCFTALLLYYEVQARFPTARLRASSLDALTLLLLPYFFTALLLYYQVQARFPTARLRASSLDAFTAYLSSSPAVLARLPVVTGRIH